ncbi:DNA ligase D [Paracoccus sp. MBLB3053]|uniref:DNA ligase (ATP) n=1 Tax=Paracoccus aurantius TaxID=3073814 RepID=A0ABU2HUY6_9RHOB|nr:DNA ligase D [Paracoccus sp. MBLB3053]MDS9468865.1 DNA ligase D [Paracoccus sp. MBLB3053]
MALETYREMRDFTATPEPKGRKARKTGHAFVIQKHAARRLHYDFRLEMDGVLKSWAVTRGPSLDPAEKRLAVHVEDHPLEYGDFEGTIPKGEYGAGDVILWDRGTWQPEGDAAKGYAKGHLEFTLQGQKLQGRWHLVRMQGKPGEKRENWLLIKGDDEFARTGPDILKERPRSVASGRDIAELSGKVETRGKKVAMPDFVKPMLATLGRAAPSGPRWLHEIKFDGYRLQARIVDGKPRLLTRSGLDWTGKFGKPILAALEDLPLREAILDAELVVEGDSGASDFPALQADLSAGREDRFRLYVFDLLYLNGRDLRGLPLVERKKILAPLIPEGDGLIRLSQHFEDDGALVLRHACRLSLEGIVSKLRDSTYRSGRGRGWVKSKCSARQEFVIAGFTPSSAAPKAIGSLVMGVYEEGKLRHVGRVGTGFSRKMAGELYQRLQALGASESPFADKLTADAARQVIFVRPELVAEVEFRAWTADGNLRHASFRGLREDKKPQEIMRETPAKPAPEQRRTVRLTHPDRIYWPDAGVTKAGLADYYAEIWPRIAPFVTGRPLALLRCPEGIKGQTFFQKHVWKGIGRQVAPVVDPKHKSEAALISVNDLDGLIALVQAAALEIHPWGATVTDWERPDVMVMDLDPGEGVDWSAVTQAAEEVRQRLEAAGLAAFLKTSGGKGLHVVSPLSPKADWREAKAFAKAMAEAMASDTPDRYVATIAKSKRRGRILIDYLRNQRGATAVAPYSTRARPGAPVSTPLHWDELGPGIGPAHFTVSNLRDRLEMQKRDPWDGFRGAAIPLPARP